MHTAGLPTAAYGVKAVQRKEKTKYNPETAAFFSSGENLVAYLKQKEHERLENDDGFDSTDQPLVIDDRDECITPTAASRPAESAPRSSAERALCQIRGEEERQTGERLGPAKRSAPNFGTGEAEIGGKLTKRDSPESPTFQYYPSKDVGTLRLQKPRIAFMPPAYSTGPVAV